MPDLTAMTRQEKFLNGDTDMEPITRREYFYAGRESELPEGHQEPETREEWFIQKYRGGGGDVTVVPLSVTENGTYSEEGKAYSPVSVNVPLPQNAYLLKSVANLPAPIASFNDGEDMVMPSLKVAIEPQQDLHGYDVPWAGGAGKNKFYIDLPHEEVSGSATYLYELTLKPNTAYTMSSNVPQDNLASLYFNGGATNVNGVWNGTPRTFTSDENGTLSAYVRFFTSQGGIDLYTAVKNGQYYIQLEEGSTATSYAPYSNICPISGWDEVNVTRTGKNLFDKVNCGVYNGYIAGTQVYGSPNHRTIYIPCKPNTTYSSANFSGNNRKGLSYSSEVPSAGLVVPTPLDTITTDANAKYLLCYCYNANSDTVSFDDVKNALDIELGSVVPTSYSAYAGNTYTIDLDGTRYGGELDVINGIGREYKEYPSYNGETLIGPWISDRDVYAEGTTPTIGAQVVDKGDISTFNTVSTAVKSLRGVNNVYANTGDITDAEYFSKEV